MKEKRLERELEKEREGMWDRVRESKCLTKRGLERERECLRKRERKKIGRWFGERVRERES